MAPNILVLDLETKSIFSDHADRRCDALGVSVVGTYCYQRDQYRVYEEAEIPELEQRLTERPLVVGFNIKRFDFLVLKPYLHFDPLTLPMLDILEILHKALGHRVSLESVAQATLGSGKSGSGLDAVDYYRRGEIAKLKQYCQDDVRVTKTIYEYGAEHGELFYTSKFGNTRGRCPVSWQLTHPETTTASETATQCSLF
ncbi:MAG: ribonuclease H-like domain-containing protein [Deltaproteobacteria bacterium]|nr:ribonuclease H-like domain-containing protein [Deltaproteobacteria bacterium]